MSELKHLNKNNALNPERLILGIDPGTNIMGFGLVLVRSGKIELVDMGIISMQKLTDHAEKLKKIFHDVNEIIAKHNPDEMAIEAPFYGKNVQSMLKLGRAQGVAYAAALSKDIPVTEYSPRKIKQSITGQGQSSKEQVASMLYSLLKIREKAPMLDATDALAVAVCHYFQRKTNGSIVQSRNYSGWSSFLKANPDRGK